MNAFGNLPQEKQHRVFETMCEIRSIMGSPDSITRMSDLLAQLYLDALCEGSQGQLNDFVKATQNQIQRLEEDRQHWRNVAKQQDARANAMIEAMANYEAVNPSPRVMVMNEPIKAAPPVLEPCVRCGVVSTRPDGEHYCHKPTPAPAPDERDDPHADLGYEVRK